MSMRSTGFQRCSSALAMRARPTRVLPSPTSSATRKRWVQSSSRYRRRKTYSTVSRWKSFRPARIAAESGRSIDLLTISHHSPSLPDGLPDGIETVRQVGATFRCRHQRIDCPRSTIEELRIAIERSQERLEERWASKEARLQSTVIRVDEPADTQCGLCASTRPGEEEQQVAHEGVLARDEPAQNGILAAVWHILERDAQCKASILCRAGHSDRDSERQECGERFQRYRRDRRTDVMCSRI